MLVYPPVCQTLEDGSIRTNWVGILVIERMIDVFFGTGLPIFLGWSCSSGGAEARLLLPVCQSPRNSRALSGRVRGFIVVCLVLYCTIGASVQRGVSISHHQFRIHSSYSMGEFLKATVFISPGQRSHSQEFTLTRRITTLTCYKVEANAIRSV